jgi:hypothetical protein
MHHSTWQELFSVVRFRHAVMMIIGTRRQARIHELIDHSSPFRAYDNR